MANILIVDLLEESAYLLRSLLRGRGHAVSIAIAAAEAQAKLETGLFDTLVMDLCEVNKERIAIGRFANDTLPGLPLVALTTQKEEAKIEGIELFGKLYRPIQGARVNDVCDRAVRHALSLGARRTNSRISVDIPMTLQIGDISFNARATDLSARGFAIDADGEAFSDERLDQLVGMSSKERIKAVWNPKGGERCEATGRIAFVDRYRRYTGKMIGVVFEQVSDPAKGFVDHLLNPTPEPVAAADASAAVITDAPAASA